MDFVITDPLTDTQAMRFYKILEGQIVSGELPPGRELSERSISDQLRIGRTPVREALQKLAANHLVLVEPRRGTFVSPILLETTTELFYVARPLESLLMVRAGERGSHNELCQLRRLASGLRSATTDPVSLYAEIDELVAVAAKNPYLVAVLAPMKMLIQRIRIFCGLASDRLVTEAYADLNDCIARQGKDDIRMAFEKYTNIFESMVMTYLSKVT